MSQVTTPNPYSNSIIADLTGRLIPSDQSMEGGINIFTETIPANDIIQVYKQQNPYRKTLTLLNTGSVALSLLILNKQNQENLIPLPPGGGYSFVQVIRGYVEQCINGIGIIQYLTSCEYAGVIKIKNATGTNGTLLVIEGI